MINRYSIFLFTVVFFLFNFTFCSYVKFLGPYKGKVVDQDNGKPIEGAIVFIHTYTRTPNPGGYSSKYAGHTEVFTDENGEFNTSKLLLTFRPITVWGEVHFLILKPGYKKYSWFTGQALKQGEVEIQEREKVTINFKKLNTEIEIKENRRFSCIPSDPCELSKNVMLYRNIERLKLSLSPFSNVLEEYKTIASNQEMVTKYHTHFSKHELALWKEFGEELEKYNTKKNGTGNNVKPIVKVSSQYNLKTKCPPRIEKRGDEVLMRAGRSVTMSQRYECENNSMENE